LLRYEDTLESTYCSNGGGVWIIACMRVRHKQWQIVFNWCQIVLTSWTRFTQPSDIWLLWRTLAVCLDKPTLFSASTLLVWRQ